MKKFAFLFLPLALMAADPQKASSTTKPAPAASAKPAAPLTVPADATEIAPHVWRHTDSSGKTWIYRQTPFGLSRIEERTPPSASSTPVASVEVKATDLGDSVRFERPMPMGNRVWTVKKADLSADEKSWLEKSSARKVAEK